MAAADDGQQQPKSRLAGIASSPNEAVPADHLRHAPGIASSPKLR